MSFLRTPSSKRRALLGFVLPCLMVVSACATQRFGVPEDAAPGTVFRDCADCPEMVVIGEGSVLMRTPNGNQSRVRDEGPIQHVDIDRRFAIGVYELTFEEWESCVRDGGCGGYLPDDEGWGRDTRPVINVDWHDANSFIDWLSQRTQKHYRLPSEAEWEFAARAGTTGPFHFGKIGPSKANYDAQVSFEGSETGGISTRTEPVGRYEPNTFGLYDVHGNVAEWVANCSYYFGQVVITQKAEFIQGCTGYFVRGGGWDSFPRYLQSGSRNSAWRNSRANSIGFRVAREIEQ